MKPLLHSVLPRPPHPARDGLAIRNFHLLEALTREFRVRAFVLAEPERASQEALYPADVEVEEVPQAARRARRLAAVAASAVGGAYPAWVYRSRRLASRLREEAERNRPAWILAHSYHVAPMALEGGRPVWVDFHNVDSEIWRRLAERSTCAPVRVFARLQAPRIARLERDLTRRAAGLSCVSERDAEVLGRLASATPLVVPNGVDLARYAFRPEPAEEEIVLFVGDLAWPPNQEAVRWLREAVWDRVVRSRPRARAEILGRGAPASLLRRARPDFVFLGEGGDTRSHWGRAAVAVVPLSVAGGTRLKILEAAACGVPVVSTPVGAEGLCLDRSTEVRVEEGAEDFAAAVAALLADRERRRLQAAAARRRVEELYGWDTIGAAFARELARRSERAA